MKIFIKNTDSCFFDDDNWIFSDERAIREAKEAYASKYPSETDIDEIEWDVVREDEA